MDGQPVGLVEAAQVLELPAAPTPPATTCRSCVVSDRSHRFGLVVDAFLRRAATWWSGRSTRGSGKVPNISSASVLDDGWPVLIVDVEDLVRSIDNLLQAGAGCKRCDAPRAARPRGRASGSWSWTTRSPSASWSGSSWRPRATTVDVAVDGMDGWNAVRGGDYRPGRQRRGHAADGRHRAGPRASSEDATLQRLPVVIVSYKDREEDRMRGLDAGANGYLTKSSFHDQTFLETVADLIGEA